MTARSTAEIIADLRECCPSCDEAADRLVELDAEGERMTAALGDFMRMQTRLQRSRDSARAEVDQLQKAMVDGLGLVKAEGDRLRAELAIRPPCPTCGGTKRVPCDCPPGTCPFDGYKDCPENGGDCDGKVTIERLVAVFNAAFDDSHQHAPIDCCRTYLRSVKP